MSDVAAIVLTVGEETTGRALESLQSQTLPVEEVVRVEGVTPFGRAFNSAVARVERPFVVQVDADMVLDPDCVEVLRDAMTRNIGITVGALRDPLVGPIAGVKMFRRSCLEGLPLRDTIGPEVDFYLRLGRRGWLTRYLTPYGRGPARDLALGAHLPDYTPEYVFGTYYLLGSRYAHRADAGGVRWRLSQLRSTPHPMAAIARIAFAHGILAGETADISKPRPSAADAAFLHRLVTTPPSHEMAPGLIRQWMALSTGALFESLQRLGASLRSSPAALLGALHLLGRSDEPRSLLAEVALGGGALAPQAEPPVGFERLAARWATPEPLESAA
jgi:hypothetical protein